MTAARVVGAGLSGLSTAWRLAEQGAQVEIFDAAPRPGGLIGTTRTPWGPAEHAANAFVWNDAVAAWFRKLRIEPVFALPSSRRRFVYRNGRARRWPLTPMETLSTLAYAGRSVMTRSRQPRADETVADWGRRVMGPSALTHLLAPALQGIYAASPDRLSAKAVFGHRRKRSPVMAVPAGGMGEFISVLWAALEHRGVRFHMGRAINAVDAGTPTWICTNAPSAATLLRPHAPAAAELVAKVELAALASVTAFYEPHPDDVHGFGVLFPRDSGIRALGVLFNADIFPGRGTHRSETWIYGGSMAGALPFKTDLPELVARDRTRLTGRAQDALGAHVAYWPGAFPIYNEAVARLGTVSTLLPPWLHLHGNYLGKRGVSDLVSGATDVREARG
jgi:oxygen-dependent protoporphyrinogen oxidase